MTFRTNLTAALTVAILATSALPSSAFPLLGSKKKDDQQITRKPTAAQNALIDKSIVREAVVLKALKERQPLVETYIQNMKPDPIMFQTPESDDHFLTRVDFGKQIGDKAYATEKHDEKTGIMGKLKKSLGGITGLTKSLRLSYNEGGFVRLIVIDSGGPNGDGYDRKNYTFAFVRNEFLGTIPCVVFDVEPIKKGQAGRFFGRIWVERNGGNIVRYNGDIQGEQEGQKEYLHFDSWRTNVQPDLWMPTASYVEETDAKSPTHSLKMKAINYIWGYQLKMPNKDADQASLEVEGAVDESNQATDLSPLQAQREWVQQAEDNVIDRLYTAGLIDAPSDFDNTLALLANNVLAYNQIATDRPLKVRTLLTSPLESLAIGDTILLSKSLIDTTSVPSDDQGTHQLANLNALLAFQIAHIILGHRIDTKYAFSDRLLFPNEQAFQRIPMNHTDNDNVAAAKKAMELLSVKDLADGQQYFSLFLQQLKARDPGLKALNTPQIGDSLLKPDGTFWMEAIISKGPKLDNKDLKQQGAMPLAAYLRFDPWTDQVVQMHTTIAPLLGAPDKMPFEVAPVYLRLAYYKAPDAPAAAAAGAAAAAADPNTPAPPPPADGTAAATPPATGAAAPADAAATPPATAAAPGTTTPATTPPPQ